MERATQRLSSQENATSKNNTNYLPVFQGLVTLLLTTGTATATTASWYNIKKPAAYLMVPYLAWLIMASALNYRLWNDNRNKKQSE